MIANRTLSKTLALAAFLVLLGSWAYAADCSGRYEVMDDGTVTDCRTGLVWLQNAKCTDTSAGIANPTGLLSWYDAMKWAAGLGDGLCGLTDGSHAGNWRLPTKTELMAMVAYAKMIGYSNPLLTNAAGTAQWTTNGDAFSNVQSDYYWSSTTTFFQNGGAWLINMYGGTILHFAETFTCYVWAVRGGQSGTFGDLSIQ